MVSGLLVPGPRAWARWSRNPRPGLKWRDARCFVIRHLHKLALPNSSMFNLTVPRSPLRQIRNSCASGIFIVYTIGENRAFSDL